MSSDPSRRSTVEIVAMGICCGGRAERCSAAKSGGDCIAEELHGIEAVRAVGALRAAGLLNDHAGDRAGKGETDARAQT